MSKQILIVDDDPRCTESLGALLIDTGYDVRVAHDDRQAAQTLKEFPADTVLLDIGLPVLSGDSFANFLLMRYPDIRIIFISGNYGMVDPERFGEGTLFLPKPLNIENLLAILKAPLPSTRQPRTPRSGTPQSHDPANSNR